MELGEGRVLSYEGVCGIISHFPGFLPIPFLLSLGKGFSPPSAQRQHRAAGGIPSKQEGLLTVGRNEASAFSKLLGKHSLWLRPGSAAQLSSADPGWEPLLCSPLGGHVQEPIPVPTSDREVWGEQPLFCSRQSQESQKSQGKGDLSKLSRLIFKDLCNSWDELPELSQKSLGAKRYGPEKTPL